MEDATKKCADELGYKAKELVIGMRKRVGRDPDIADYAAAFLPILRYFSTEVMRYAIWDKQPK